MSDPVVIIGAGLSGLCCACELHRQGVEFLMMEAADGVGGRVRTDAHEGFLLDRGFQVLLTAYPEAARQLDYNALNLRNFEPGSLIRTDGGFQFLSDPWRRPQHALRTLFSSVGGFIDKLRVARLRWSSSRGTLDDVFARHEQSTDQELRSLGFSNEMLEQFFRPFLGGVFLDRELETSSRMLYFVFRMFSRGHVAIPARGMGEISNQLAGRLPSDSIRFNTPVAAIEGNKVRLESGEVIPAQSVVVAAEQSAASKLLPELATDRPCRSVSCVYFSADEPPTPERMLILNGTGHGLINNMCVPSQVAPELSSTGLSLISVSVLKSPANSGELQQGVRQQLRDWFGNSVDAWKHLRTYHIANALPNQSVPALDPAIQPANLRPGVFVCGDYRANGSINGAMLSGRMAAEKLLKHR